MHGEWERAARELLAEGGHRRPVRSAFRLARDLNIDVVGGERAVAARLVFDRPRPFVRVDDRLSSAMQEEQVAIELGRYALIRAGYGEPSEFRARQVAELLVLRGPYLRTATRATAPAADPPNAVSAGPSCAAWSVFPSG
jgi:hypothetical protein